MHLVTAILSIAVIVLTGYFLFRSPAIKRNGKPIRRSLDQLPFVGNGLIFLQPREKLFAWFVKCERYFGLETFQISVPTLPAGVVINDPKNLEYVLKNEGLFLKGDFFKSRAWDLFGGGIINADGELWKIQRRAGTTFLSNANLKVLTEGALPRYLQETVESLKLTKDDATIDLSPIFHELTTQLFGRMAYNMEMHESDPFTVAFDYASGATGNRFQNPLWKITEGLSGSKFRRSVATVKAFGADIVANAVCERQGKPRASKQETKSESTAALGEVSGTLIHSLLDSIDDHETVADAALNYLTAGRDTTAQALTWLFYLLMRRVSSLDAIRNEVEGVMKTALGVSEPISRNDLENIDTAIFQPSSLPYAMAAFYEALRLYPVIPFELRQCMSSTTLPDGTFLPKDAVLVWCTWAMNRSTLTWGEDAHEFRPERWLENGALITKTAYEFPVFNGGARLCLGKKMAESVAVQVIATLVSNFDFLPLDNKKRFSKNSLTLPMEGGLPCRVKVRAF